MHCVVLKEELDNGCGPYAEECLPLMKSPGAGFVVTMLSGSMCVLFFGEQNEADNGSVVILRLKTARCSWFGWAICISGVVSSIDRIE